VKGFSNYFFNLSAALLAASVARAWGNGQVDPIVPAWLAIAICLLLVACKVLNLLEAPSEDAS
jgi:hypothetical protein